MLYVDYHFFQERFFKLCQYFVVYPWTWPKEPSMAPSAQKLAGDRVPGYSAGFAGAGIGSFQSCIFEDHTAVHFADS